MYKMYDNYNKVKQLEVVKLLKFNLTYYIILIIVIIIVII